MARGEVRYPPDGCFKTVLTVAAVMLLIACDPLHGTHPGSPRPTDNRPPGHPTIAPTRRPPSIYVP